MSSTRDWLFGDQDNTKGIRFQQADNERRQQFAQESGAMARRDLLDIMPRAQENFQQSARAAIDVARRAPQAQLKTLSRAGTNAQRALLGGMDMYQNAIMGQPTGVVGEGFSQNPAGFRPVAIGMSEFAGVGKPFYKSSQPLWLGKDRRDWEEYDMRLNNPDDYWEMARPARAANLFPEQYREPIRYDYGGKTTTGGDVVRSDPDLYNQALTGGIPQLTWSGR